MSLVIGLAGPLGAGKTEWVKGLADGLGVDPDLVVSPTFVIASEYAGRRALVHADLYRVEHAGELESAGLLDWLAPGSVVAIEWADRFPQALPADRIEVRIERPATAAGERLLELTGSGPIARGVLAHFEQAWHLRRTREERVACR